MDSIQKLDERPAFSTVSAPFSNLLIRFNVISLLKGTPTISTISLKASIFDVSAIPGNGTGAISARQSDFSGFKAKVSYLLFAKVSEDGKYYILVNPVAPSAWMLGTQLPRFQAQDTPVEKIYKYFLLETTSQDYSLREHALIVLSYLGELFVNPARSSVEVPDQAKNRLRGFARDQVTPVVVSLTKDKDKEIGDTACYVAARLQVGQVIPKLASIAVQNTRIADLAMDAISGYTSSAATPFLNNLLKYPDRRVRYHAVQSLFVIQDKHSIPYLLDDIHDHDVGVRYQVEVTLFQLTREYPPSETKEYTAFWQNWAVAHQDELKILREPSRLKFVPSL